MKIKAVVILVGVCVACLVAVPTPGYTDSVIDELMGGDIIVSESTTCPSGGIPPCWRQFEMESGATVVCQFPVLHYDECEDFHVDDCIEVDGYVDKMDGGEVVMFATAVKICQ